MAGNVNPRNHSSEPQAKIVGTSRIVAIGQLRANPWNYNTQAEETFGKLVNSMRRFGFSQPVICRTVPGVAGWEIINGEHRWSAGKVLHMLEIPILDMGDIPDAQAKELCIVLNELGGEPDQVRLADLLADIKLSVGMEEMREVMPFSPRELDMYLEVTDFSFDKASTADTRKPEEKAADAQAAADADPAAAENAARAGATAPAPAAPPEDPATRRLVVTLPADKYDWVVARLERLNKDHAAALLAYLDTPDEPPTVVPAVPKRRRRDVKA